MCPDVHSQDFVSSQVQAELQDVSTKNRKKGLKRRARITRKVELQQYGFTEGCLGCDAAAKSAKAVGRSEACRKRIEAKMLGEEVAAARLLRARKRRGEFHGAVPTAKQTRSAATAAAKEAKMLLARAAAAAAAASEESACGDRRRRRPKGP